MESGSGRFAELLSAGLGPALQGAAYQRDRVVRVCQHGLRGAGCARADPAFLLRAGSLERQPVERGQDNSGAGVVERTDERERKRLSGPTNMLRACS